MICLYQREEALFLAGRRPGEVILVQVWTSRNDNDRNRTRDVCHRSATSVSNRIHAPWKRKDYGGFIRTRGGR